MKYIRTKDGVYEPTKWQCDLSGETILVKADNKSFNNGTIFKRDIIKETYTIKELCDWFLIIVNGRINSYYVSFEYAKSHLFLFEKCENVEIKGAIETYKGLIYVAKMNQEGELELL